MIKASPAGISLFLPICAVLLSGPALGSRPGPDPWELTSSVSDGELRFVPRGAAAGAHAHSNRIRISERSLSDGWVELEQCHRDMDAVPAAQVVFHPRRIRAIEVTASEHIGEAWVEGHAVQLKDVAPGARLCLRAESRALQLLGDGRFRLRNGPYMRRFLDGYYPMRVFLDIEFPSRLLRLRAHDPQAQEGFEVRVAPGRIGLEAAFEGRLVTCFDFCGETAPQCAGPFPACAID